MSLKGVKGVVSVLNTFCGMLIYSCAVCKCTESSLHTVCNILYEQSSVYVLLCACELVSMNMALTCLCCGAHCGGGTTLQLALRSHLVLR